MSVEDRIAALELRVLRLERASVPLAAPVIPAPRPAPRPKPKREPIELEDFLGGRVLAWLGGIAVIAGLAFLLTVAISRGWIGESGRTALAALISTALLIAGARARERRVRNDAALAAAAAGVAGLFGTLVVAGQVYDLIPLALALPRALLVGAAATALAVRWRAQVMGWLGLVGALLAPAVLGDDGSIAFLAVAYGATVAVLVRERWTALMFAAFAIVTPQWALWLADVDVHRSQPLTVLVLVVFGALTAAAAVGFEIRRRERTVRIPAVVLLVLNALVLDLAGMYAVHPSGAWLVAVAAAHLAVGLAGTRIPRVSHELSLVALGLGVILADIAFAALVSGLPLTLGWAAGAVGFGWLLRRAKTGSDRAFAMAGLGGHLASALTHALVLDVPSQQLAGGGAADLTAIAAIAAIGASAAVSGRLAPRLRIPLDTLALAALAYASVLTLDGVALTLALAGQAVGLAALARRDTDPVAAYGSVAFAGLAAAHAATVLAPATALLDGLGAPLPALAGLVAVVAAQLAASRAPFAAARMRPSLDAGAAVTALYLASAEVVTYAGDASQTALSVLWAAAGVGTLIAGLVADRARLRYGALALLGLTAAKVFVYDLASLDSMARVGSLVGMGLLLLAGGFAWQRVRPRTMPDLREAGADAC